MMKGFSFQNGKMKEQFYDRKYKFRRCLCKKLRKKKRT